jgi:hypothetical protein
MGLQTRTSLFPFWFLGDCFHDRSPGALPLSVKKPGLVIERPRMNERGTSVFPTCRHLSGILCALSRLNAMLAIPALPAQDDV